MKTATGLFDDYSDAMVAVEELEDAGFTSEEISVVSNNAAGRYSDNDNGAAEGAGTGAGLGALAGGTGGLLTGLGLMAIPGVGRSLLPGGSRPLSPALPQAPLLAEPQEGLSERLRAAGSMKMTPTYLPKAFGGAARW